MDRKRRNLLIALGLGGVGGLSGGVALERYVLNTDTDRPFYFKKLPLERHNPELTVEPSKEIVQRGEEIMFEVTNTGNSDSIPLGCNINWALQRSDGDGWEHVTWTEGRWHSMCATGLGPGDTMTEQMTMSKEGLNQMAQCVERLDPGTYRFILFVPSPPAWVEFELE